MIVVILNIRISRYRHINLISYDADCLRPDHLVVDRDPVVSSGVENFVHDTAEGITAGEDIIDARPDAEEFDEEDSAASPSFEVDRDLAFERTGGLIDDGNEGQFVVDVADTPVEMDLGAMEDEHHVLDQGLNCVCEMDIRVLDDMEIQNTLMEEQTWLERLSRMDAEERGKNSLQLLGAKEKEMEYLKKQIQELQSNQDNMPVVCKLLTKGIAEGHFEDKQVLYNYIEDIARASVSPTGSIQYSETTKELMVLLYNIGHGSAIDSMHHNLFGASRKRVEEIARVGANGMYLPREVDVRTFSTAREWYMERGIDLSKETCVVVFDATALLPYIGLFADGSIGGLVDYEKYPGALSNEDLKDAFNEENTRATQVMGFVLVVTSLPNSPPYVLAAHEHRSCDYAVVSKWNVEAIRNARSAGVMHLQGLVSDGDAGPRKFSAQEYSGAEVPNNAMGLQRGRGFTTFFGRYDDYASVDDDEVEGGQRETTVPPTCAIFRSDRTHLIKKARNAMLALATRTLVLGDYHVSLQDAFELYIKLDEAGIKGVMNKDSINVLDKQSQVAAENLVGNSKLPPLLVAHAGRRSYGTATYIHFTSGLHEAFTATEMPIEIRIQAALECMIFFDYWKIWLTKATDKNGNFLYKPSRNFISSQLYYDTCITISAFIVDYCSKCIDTPDIDFYPNKYSSDPIENLFGQIRMLIRGKPDVDFVAFIQSCRRIQHDWGLRYKTDAEGKLIYYSQSTKNRKHTQGKQAPVPNIDGSGKIAEALIKMINGCAKKAEAVVFKTLLDLGMKIDQGDRDLGMHYVINHPDGEDAPREPDEKEEDWRENKDTIRVGDILENRRKRTRVIVREIDPDPDVRAGDDEFVSDLERVYTVDEINGMNEPLSPESEAYGDHGTWSWDELIWEFDFDESHSQEVDPGLDEKDDDDDATTSNENRDSGRVLDHVGTDRDDDSDTESNMRDGIDHYDRELTQLSSAVSDSTNTAEALLRMTLVDTEAQSALQELEQAAQKMGFEVDGVPYLPWGCNAIARYRGLISIREDAHDTEVIQALATCVEAIGRSGADLVDEGETSRLYLDSIASVVLSMQILLDERSEAEPGNQNPGVGSTIEQRSEGTGPLP